MIDSWLIRARSQDSRQHKTLDGKVAGLQSATALKEESRKLKEKEDQVSTLCHF